MIGIVDLPDNASMAAFALAIGAGGACSKVKTTTLLSLSEGISAMKKASTNGYKPVGVKRQELSKENVFGSRSRFGVLASCERTGCPFVLSAEAPHA